jgi:hypothetical protein
MAGPVAELASEGRRVEARSAELKKTLGLRDLVLQRIVSLTAACIVCLTSGVRAQLGDSTRCDSIVFAARRDSIRAALYVGVVTPTVESPADQRRVMSLAIGTGFVAPRPFRVSVFSGPAQMRTIRRLGSDTSTALRAPSVTGIYRAFVKRGTEAAKVEVLRASLVPGFDSAAIDAIRSGIVLVDVFQPPIGVDSIQLEVTFGTDSMPNSIKIVEAVFPRMPVIDAVPRPDNPPPKTPTPYIALDALLPLVRGGGEDSTRRQDILLRFVVDRAGLPAMETIEVLRGNSMPYLRAALEALPLQRFTPARVNGCAVAQVMSYPFAFVSPTPGVPLRH